MITRRSFLAGAAGMALLPPLVRADTGDREEPRRYVDLPQEPVPEGYPYDRPVPDTRSEVMTPLPRRVVAGYWTYWGSPIRLADIPERYNTVFLFHATPVGGAPGTTGAVRWNAPGDGRGAATHFVADLAEFRRTRTAILTVGGARANVDLSTRARAQAFLDSVKRIYGDLGGFDGLDWNNYEGEQQPNTEQMIWISQQLKATYGRDFAITSPPAPWRPVDVAHCRAMIDAGVMDMVSPQYYGGPGLATEEHIVTSVTDWVARMGDAGRVGVGFGMATGGNYSTPAAVQGAWKTLSARHPGLRGGFNWNVATDEGMGWPFADDIGPRMLIERPRPPIVPPLVPVPFLRQRRTHTVVAGDTLEAIAERHGIADWREISALDGDVTPESLRPGQVLVLPGTATGPGTAAEPGTAAGPGTAAESGTASGATPAPAPAPSSGSGDPRIPDPVVGAHWSRASGLPLTSVPPECTVVWIAMGDAEAGGSAAGPGPHDRDTSALGADIAELRRRTDPPRLILSSSAGADDGPGLGSGAEADEFAARVIRIARDLGLDGFAWDLDLAPRSVAAAVERASRAIVTGMRRRDPGFSLAVTSRPEPSGDLVLHDHGPVYADVVRRCRDVLDVVQPQYHHRDPRVLDLDHLRAEVQAWLDCGLRPDQVGFLLLVPPAALEAGDGPPATGADAGRAWDTLRTTWPGLRGLGTRALSTDRVDGAYSA